MDDWSIGELAAQTGLTVRTLHHYDEIGLARPSRRTAAGHRRYTAGDVARLHRIVALRGFGFGLAEIATLLDADQPTARDLVEQQYVLAAEQIVRATAQRDRLAAMIRRLDAAGHMEAGDLMALIEGMTSMDADAMAKMAALRQALTEKLTDAELAEMSARRQAAWDAMTPEEQENLRRSRPPLAG
jgi:MerR family transcriptional regulator, thiopeptide resistance regulator